MTPIEIRTLRTQLGLSQYEFSNLVGVRRETVVRWEKQGGAVPHPNHVKKMQELAATFGYNSQPPAIGVV